MIRMEFEGKDEVLEKLRAVSEPGIRSQILDDFGSYMEAEIDRRFETETGPDGQKWKQSYRARTEGGQTLSDSGILRQSITHSNTADKLEVGSAMIYAAIHQFGGEIKPVKADKLAFRVGSDFILVDSVTMPARPFLGFTDEDGEELVHIIHDHWQGALQ